MLGVKGSSHCYEIKKSAGQMVPKSKLQTLPLFISSACLLIVWCCTLVVSCGGDSAKPSPMTSSLAGSSSTSFITLGGQVTYDYVPHNLNKIGLNYSESSVRPARGLVVELLDSDNFALASANTDNLGNYSFNNVELNKPVKIRAKAQLLRSTLAIWNFKVTDNTNGNNLYAMDGALIKANESAAVRNLHAASGWAGASYTQPRTAAPFAIIDSIFDRLERIVVVNQDLVFSPLELRWSVKNKTAEGNLALGEIGTSFYSDSAIYILGDENNDTDEYDRHVILHEWAHYLELELFRSDSMGGDHSYGDKLDMRVAMSEGFASAFSAMILDDPDYRDVSGPQQRQGFSDDVSRKSHIVRGWYSEASIQSVIYNFYVGDNGRETRNFGDIFNVFNSANYVSNVAMTSIYLFANELRAIAPSQSAYFNYLLGEQNIEITNAVGEGESNSGGYAGSLPIYKILSTNNAAWHYSRRVFRER